jgi:hypothetical protein
MAILLRRREGEVHWSAPTHGLPHVRSMTGEAKSRLGLQSVIRDSFERFSHEGRQRTSPSRGTGRFYILKLFNLRQGLGGRGFQRAGSPKIRALSFLRRRSGEYTLRWSSAPALSWHAAAGQGPVSTKNTPLGNLILVPTKPFGGGRALSSEQAPQTFG